MPSLGRGWQFILLLWKEVTLLKRKKCMLAFQISLPLAFAFLLLCLRILSDNTTRPAQTWSSFSVTTPTHTGSASKTKVLYAPAGNKTDVVMGTVNTAFGGNYTVHSFASESLLDAYYESNIDSVWAAIIFASTDYSTTLPDAVSYTLRVSRQSSDDTWETENTYPFFRTLGYRNNDMHGGEPYYFSTGFLALQYQINRAITIEHVGSSGSFDALTIEMNKMPYVSFVEDALLRVLQIWLPLFVMIGFFTNATQTIKSIVYEKEKRLKEAMTLMGMNSKIYWSATITKSLFFMFIACIAFTVIFKIPVGSNGRVLTYSDGSVLLVFLLLYSFSIITFSVMVSTFFSKANVATYVGGILYFATYFPWFFLSSRYENMTQLQKLASCFLMNTAMAMGCSTLGLYEGTGDGVKWSNFFKTATIDDNFSLGISMVMLFLDSLIHLFVAWYVGNIFPGEYGIPRPFYFPFTRTYWCGPRKRKEAYDTDVKPPTANPEFFERDPPGLKSGISIQCLRKVFGSGKGKKVAVKNTNLNMFEGQITALLGHNGAGKTTTISMLTGFIAPTKGKAIINGHNIKTEMALVRENLGYCPQHDILFDTMTVEEHLYFYARLKGAQRSTLNKEIMNMLKTVGLEAKQDALSKTLSGGQKRKLSVAIAAIGGSKTLILDEPTSGMDPAARRQTWDILQKFKEGRTIVLSTHFMDEADLLGDRIAIMAEGVVKCCGASLFLKKAFGAGYHLVIVKDKSCNVPKITEVVTKHVPTAVKESEISAELSYMLPFDQSSKFESLFKEIEQASKELGIQSFGTSATTMEEVFLIVGESGKEDAKDEAAKLKTATHLFSGSKSDLKSKNLLSNGFTNTAFSSVETVVDSEGVSANGTKLKPNKQDDKQTDVDKLIALSKDIKKNSGIALMFQQFSAMFVKKVIHSWRNRVLSLVQLLMPVIFTIFALLIENTASVFTDEPPLVLDLSPFKNDYITLYSDIGGTSTIDDYYKDIFCCKTDGSSYTSFNEFSLSTMTSTGISTFSKTYIIGGDFGTTNTAFFNGDPYHTPGITLSYMMTAVLQQLKTDSKYSITTTNHPFAKSTSDKAGQVSGSSGGTGFSVAFNILFGMAFLTSSFLVFLIKERTSGAKHVQKVSGVGSIVYWMGNFAWDYLNFFVPVILIVIVFAAFDPTAYTTDSHLGIVFFLFLLYGCSSLPFTYLFAFVFKTAASGMVTMTLMNIGTGLATLIAVFVLNINGLNLQNIAIILDWIFAIFIPHYCLGTGVMNIYVNYEYRRACENSNYQIKCALPGTNTGPCCLDNCGNNCLYFTDNYLDMKSPGVGKYLLFMVIQSIVFFTILFLIETQTITKWVYKMKSHSSSVGTLPPSEQSTGEGGNDKDDDDVVNEQNRINDSPHNRLIETDSLIIKNLHKTFKKFRAVKGISVGIPKEECFGLLGQNGAGKTTTFKMLTGDEMITSGNAFLDSYDVKNHIKQVQQNLGYCPQFDALIEQMTGKETLKMYGRLRGVRENQINDLVDKLVDVMMLEKYADRQCGTYSGGNKRKLSTAISLIGDPPFIFLDEPTTGMDPGARRKLWNVLSQIRESGRTLVLTSHSMEECDALCTKIAIMVNGKFVCLGSPQHLKNKFGQGYTLILRLGLENGKYSDPSAIKNFVIGKFPSSKVFDDHQGYVHFQVSGDNVSIADVFGAMEHGRENFKIEDYSVHQTTLEQVFLTFTRNQVPPKEKKKKKRCRCLCCKK